jgi:hypothetical protein
VRKKATSSQHERRCKMGAFARRLPSSLAKPLLQCVLPYRLVIAAKARRAPEKVYGH